MGVTTASAPPEVAAVPVGGASGPGMVQQSHGRAPWESVESLSRVRQLACALRHCEEEHRLLNP